ncbi:MAG: hypothetical protein Q7S40_03185 [Opitutaceae bacterium]|nr:hypothetical protein [Opitutaceae bacterium]
MLQLRQRRRDYPHNETAIVVAENRIVRRDVVVGDVWRRWILLGVVQFLDQ